MKIVILVFSNLLLSGNPLYAQLPDSAHKSKWEAEANLLLYMVPNDFFALPILKADKNKLHLEARYNYEDFRTFSMFGGYRLSGGAKLQYSLTTMIGFVAGLSNGIAPGLEVELSLSKFSFYSEMEYLIEFSDKRNDYYYNWSELSFAPTEWLWLGVSGQKTRLYQSDWEIQRGLMVGTAFKNWELCGYYFNPFNSEHYGILSIAYKL